MFAQPMSLLAHAPSLSLQEAASLARDLYGIDGTLQSLPSERDQNFLLTSKPHSQFVLKIANSKEQRSLLEAQNAAMRHLHSRLEFCPHVIPTKASEELAQLNSRSGTHYVRLVTYIAGKPLALTKLSSSLLSDFGRTLGTLTRHLQDFDHPAFHRDFHWDLANGINVISQYADLLPNDLREHVYRCAHLLEHSLLPLLPKLPTSVIHGDANDHNVIVQSDKVVGLIDFGDMIHSYTVGELAVGLAYIVLDKTEPLDVAREVVAGYASQWTLNADEIDALWYLVLLRLAMSLCIAAHQRPQRPENDYLSISQQSIRNSLPVLLAIDSRTASDTFRQVFVQE
jgi:Ser/Thr protein kinase RdoA (MazF antagonist)